MKTSYFLLFLTIFSCTKNTEEKEKTAVNKVLEEIVQVVNSEERVGTISFDEVIAQTKNRTLPVAENTNFDSFIEEGDYNEVNTGVLKLEEIYPSFYKEGYEYRAIASYKVELSTVFHSVVVTVFKGENEMESVLINYDINGEVIDHKIVSYDEIAEGWSKIESKIEANKLTINRIHLMDTREEAKEVFDVLDNGKIAPTTLKKLDESDLIDNVVQQLSLDSSTIKTEFVVTKVLPNDATKTIVVIPEIVDEGEHFFELNSHISLVDNTTGKIVNKYFETYKTNGWTSDAIELREITIDTAPYLVTKADRAFGIRLYFVGASHANPYTNKHLSLFVASGDTLKKVLHNYDVMNYGGEWDTDCYGAFIDAKSTLHISEELTNGYFDIVVKTKTTEIKNDEDENGDCDSAETVSHHTTVLKFNGEIYK